MDEFIPPPISPSPPVLPGGLAMTDQHLSAEVAPPISTGWRRISPVVYAGLGVLLVSAVLGIFVAGELGAFLMATWEVVLFATMCVLAYVGLEAKAARVLSRVMLCLLLLLGVGFNVSSTYLAIASDPPGVLPAGTSALLALLGYLSLFAGGVALLAALPAMRRLATGLTGTQEWTSVRALALGAVSAFTTLCLVPLVVLGEPPLLMMLQGVPDGSTVFDDGRGAAGMFRDQIYSLNWTLVAATLAVGYGVRRNWPETLERLGLRRLSARHIGLGILLTGLLLGLGYFTDEVITRTWQYFNWRTTDLTALEALFGPLISPVGAVVTGVTAGLGEEVAVRGILQPRLGILLSNLFFTSLHAYQYSWDGLASVFVIGLALGFIRKKTSTSVSALVHGGYDFVLVMMEVG
ncbi:MAG TPA: CPBP family intramembrane metalloprotease [Verrucomicrobiota bacterium]|nr:CPBP family intramembrane metalloprotease domain-containing protein [Verrucomicrobiales bacterium]HRI14909.1 CPBP family intramembrane metalloprotease [Verrucomicrobiota bacterium]